jgi:hypothetical protein
MELSPDTRVALIAALGASGIALAVLLGYLAATGTLDFPRPATGEKLAELAGQFLGFYVLGATATVGVPVFLYLRFNLVSPLVVMGGEVAFWTVFARGGDAPGAFFAVAFWPAYLAAYLAVGGAEYLLR